MARKRTKRATQAIEPQAPKKMGRPSLFTPTVRERILTAIRAGDHFEVAARFAEVSKRVFYDWLAKGRAEEQGEFRDFYEAVKHAEAQSETAYVAAIRRAIEGEFYVDNRGRKHYIVQPRPDLALKFIGLRWAARWMQVERKEITGPDGGPIQSVQLKVQLHAGSAELRRKLGLNPSVADRGEGQAHQQPELGAAE